MIPTDDNDDGTREKPIQRHRETYEKDHWETVHIDNVDLIGASESSPMYPGHGRDSEASIRIDLDGYGHGGASMHAADENIQCSVLLTPARARKLYADLGEQLDVDQE